MQFENNMNTNVLNIQSGFDPDALIKYFSSVRNLAGRYQQIYNYTGLNQYVNAQAVIDSVAQHYKLTSEQDAELSNTQDFVNFLGSIHSDGRNIAQLSLSEQRELEVIAEAKPGGIAAVRAENILCFFYEKCPDEWGSPKSNSTKPKKPKRTEKNLYEGLNTVKVAPNPANTYIEFEYKVLIPAKETVLRIIDVQGKPIKSWNLQVGNNKEPY